MTKKNNRKPGVVIAVPGRAGRATSNEVLVADYVRRLSSSTAHSDADPREDMCRVLRELGHLAKNASIPARVEGARQGRYGISVYSSGNDSYHLRIGR